MKWAQWTLLIFWLVILIINGYEAGKSEDIYEYVRRVIVLYALYVVMYYAGSFDKVFGIRRS